LGGWLPVELAARRSPTQHKPSCGLAVGCAVTLLSELQFDDPSLHADHGAVGPIIGSQLGKDGLHSTLDGFIGDRELIGNLLVGIPACDQA